MMDIKTAEKNQTRSRRVSKARILDGHPLKLSTHAILVMVLAYILITSSVSLLFSYFYQTKTFLVLWTLLPGALLGFSLLILERLFGVLKNSMLPKMGKLLTAFLLFFIHSLGYLALSSIVLNYPIGSLMEKTKEFTGMADAYNLFSVNFFIVLALLSWLRNVRSGPNPCI